MTHIEYEEKYCTYCDSQRCGNNVGTTVEEICPYWKERMKMEEKTSVMDKVKDAIIEDFDNAMEAWQGLAEKDNMFLIGRIDAYELARATVEYKFKTLGHGEWIFLGLDDNSNLGMFKCSICGREQFGRSKHCSDCGAKMDGGNK